jgi:hypothetical protein
MTFFLCGILRRIAILVINSVLKLIISIYVAFARSQPPQKYGMRAWTNQTVQPTRSAAVYSAGELPVDAVVRKFLDAV